MRAHGPEIAAVFEPSSVAVIGASEQPGSLGTVVFSNLVDGGFAGPIIPVNPRHRQVQGRPCFESLAAVDRPVDLAVIATPPATVAAIIEDCGTHGVPAAVIISGGFGETGEPGKQLERELLRAARRAGVRFIGPNCLGIMRPDRHLNASFSQRMARPGQIALVSQSGAMCTAMLDWAEPRQVGFSCVVSSGIAADVDFGEILDYLVMDPETKAIMLYVEGIRDARRFMSGLRAASRAKPVVVMKTGRYGEGREAARSHSATLLGADDVFSAALRRSGVVRVRRYSDFFAIAETLHTGARAGGPRLGIVTNGGGPGVMAADFLIDKGLPLAELGPSTIASLDAALPGARSSRNPVDVLGDATAERFASAVSACLADERVDAVLAIAVPQAITDPTAIAAASAEASKNQPKPVFACWMGDASMAASRQLFREHGIPSFSTPEAAVEAFAATAAHTANQKLLLQVPEPLSPAADPDVDGAQLVIAGALDADRRLLGVVESKALLAAFGIPIVQSVSARDAAEAVAVAEELGFPVAMKIHSADLSHKSDVGGVRLNVASGREVRIVFDELVRTVAARNPSARIDGVLIEPMWQGAHGRELMLGVVNDEVFGPAITVGLGGTMVEVIRDRSVGLPPLNRLLASSMIANTRAAQFLEPFRGKPAANRRAVEDCLLRLSDMVCELPAIETLDVNPLVVDETGARALDARIQIRAVSATARKYAHMAVHPYPRHLVSEHILANGTRLVIRPIRPEDARREQEFVDGLSERSRYLRFMYEMKKITPELVSRFTQIDYDREMALTAIVASGDGERQIAVARYVMNPDLRSCEFAIVVADDWHHKGVATELLRRLIESARERGLQHMDGIALSENRGMLALAEQLGFESESAKDDPQIVNLSLGL